MVLAVRIPPPTSRAVPVENWKSALGTWRVESDVRARVVMLVLAYMLAMVLMPPMANSVERRKISLPIVDMPTLRFV